MWQSRTNDKESTLIRRAKRAVTIPDLTAFAATLELRPIAQLLGDLPELARISEAKFTVASNVLRRRFLNEAPLAQLQLRAFGIEIASTVADEDVAQRIRDIFELETG